MTSAFSRFGGVSIPSPSSAVLSSRQRSRNMHCMISASSQVVSCNGEVSQLTNTCFTSAHFFEYNVSSIQLEDGLRNPFRPPNPLGCQSQPFYVRSQLWVVTHERPDEPWRWPVALACKPQLQPVFRFGKDHSNKQRALHFITDYWRCGRNLTYTQSPSAKVTSFQCVLADLDILFWAL